MKIYADSFKKWSRVLESYQTKGNIIGESIYLDFKNKLAYFGSSDGYGKIKFYTEDDIELNNFFIPTNKFLNIITQYDFVNIDLDYVFTNNKDSYKVSVIFDDEKFDGSLFKNSFEQLVEIEKSSINTIEKSLMFINKDEQNINYRNVFINDSYICSLTTQTPMYEAKIDIANKFSFSYGVGKTICQIGLISDGCFLNSCQNNSSIIQIESKDKEIQLIVPNNSSTQFPENRNPKFIESYMHKNQIVFQTDVFSKTISSMRTYYNNVINSNIQFTFNEGDVELKVEDKDNKIIKHCVYESINNELIGTVFNISGNKIEQCLSVLKDKQLTIALNIDSPIVRLYNNEEQQVLITRIKN